MRLIFPQKSLAFVVGCALGLTACSTLDRIEQPLERAADAVTTYRAEVLQGNVITKEQVDALRPGMLAAQVRDILGTPLVQSVFHENRWDYAYTIRRGTQTLEKRHLSVFFENGRLERFVGDDMPSEVEFATNLNAVMNRENPSGKTRLPQMQATPEQLQQSAADAAKANAAAPGLFKAEPKSYPPLSAAPNWKEPTTP